jgi:hypothetical protein
MDTNEKQIALSVLENLRADLMYAHLKNESRELDVADLLQYIYSMTGSMQRHRLRARHQQEQWSQWESAFHKERPGA